jgi:hypothetical protein
LAEGAMKVSGRKNPKGKSNPERTTRGSTTQTKSDDLPSRPRKHSTSRESQAQKLESRKPVPLNRTKVKPIGKGRAGKAA